MFAAVVADLDRSCMGMGMGMGMRVRVRVRVCSHTHSPWGTEGFHVSLASSARAPCIRTECMECIWGGRGVWASMGKQCDGQRSSNIHGSWLAAIQDVVVVVVVFLVVLVVLVHPAVVNFPLRCAPKRRTTVDVRLYPVCICLRLRIVAQGRLGYQARQASPARMSYYSRPGPPPADRDENLLL